MDWEEKLAKELPKVELHLHLDGSISPGIIFSNQIFRLRGKTLYSIFHPNELKLMNRVYTLIRVYCSKGIRKKHNLTSTRPYQSDRKMATSSKEVRCSNRSFKQVIMLYVRICLLYRKNRDSVFCKLIEYTQIITAFVC